MKSIPWKNFLMWVSQFEYQCLDKVHKSVLHVCGTCFQNVYLAFNFCVTTVGNVGTSSDVGYLDVFKQYRNCQYYTS